MRFLNFIFFMCFYCSATSQTTINLTTPNGGETYYQGQQITINWTNSGTPITNVTIELTNAINTTVSVIASNIANNGTATWTIPTTQTVGTYKIKIYRVTATSVNDYSNATFTIASPTLSVNSPNGGETFYQGGSLPIRWSTVGMSSSENISIELSQGTTTIIQQVVASPVSNSGSYNWTIPISIPVGTYRIKIYRTNTANGTILDYSNATFTIASPTLTVISPNGGETFYQGGNMPISWSTVGMSSTENISIELTQGTTTTIQQVVASPISNSGSHSWTIPISIPAGSYRIKIYRTNTASGTIVDYSNATFNITAPTITVTSPNGGETNYQGGSTTITWSSQGLTGNVNIELVNSNNIATLIQSNVANTGSYNWTIATTQATGAYRIKIYSYLNNSIVDLSNSTFNITAPTITLTSPNGGETYSVGNTISISWIASNLTGNVQIEIADASGVAICGQLSIGGAGGVASNTSPKTWVIPTNILPLPGQYKIKIYSLNNTNIKDLSDATFTINPASTFGYICTQWSPITGPGFVALEDAQAFEYLRCKEIIDNPQFVNQTENNIKRDQLAKIIFKSLFRNGTGTSWTANAGFMPPTEGYPTVFYDLQKGATLYSKEAKCLLYLEHRTNKSLPDNITDGKSSFSRINKYFFPERTIVRQDFLKVLLEAFYIAPSTTAQITASPSIFTDFNLASTEGKTYIHKAEQLGLIQGTGGAFNPTTTITRRAAFIILFRLLKKIDANQNGLTLPVITNNDYFIPNNINPENFSRSLDIMNASFNSYTKTSFGINGLVPLSFAHSYNSYITELPNNFQDLEPLGKGWNHNFNCYLQVVEGDDPTNDKRYIISWGDGTNISFLKNAGGNFVPETQGVYSSLTQVSVNFLFTTKNKVAYKFSQVAGTNIWGLVEVKDRNSNILNITWENLNAIPRVKKVFVNATSRYLDFIYNTNNQLTNVRCVTGTIDRSCVFTYTTDGDLKTYTDPKNQTSTYFYDGSANPITAHLLTRITLPKGNTVTNTYEQRKLKTSKVNANFTANVGFNTSYNNTNVSTTSSVQITRGTNTLSSSYAMNNLGLVTNATTNTATMNIGYDPSQKTKLKTITNNTTNISAGMQYDALGNVTQAVRTPTGGGTSITETFVYNSFNDVTSHTNGRGNTTVFAYDGNGNLTNIKDALNYNTVINVNTNGTVQKVTNPTGLFTSFEYDIWGNTTKTSLMNTINSLATYDDASRLIQTTDPNGIKAKYNYDAVDQVQEVISDFGGLNNSLKYEYDANGNLVKIINPKNIATNLIYNNDDQMTQYSFAGFTKLYEYNQDGSLKKFTNQKNDVYNYVYDTDGQITDDGYSTYSYDLQKRLKIITHKTNNSKVTYSYDGFNRINSISYSNGANTYTDNVGYEYDNNNNVTKIIYTPTFAVSYTYDALDRMIRVYNTQNNATYASYNYLNDGRLQKTTNGNNTTTDYTYDNVGRLNGFANKKQNGAVISNYNYEMDNVGNHTKETANEPFAPIMPVLPNATVPYTHDDANRMKTQGLATLTTFTEDGNGNNTNATGQWSSSYTYDKNDNLLTSTAPTITAEYDGLENRRLKNSTQYTLEILGGSNVLMERNASNGTPNAYYIHGLGMICRLDANATNPAYYHYDYRGSTTAISDAAQNITHKYIYGAFGEMLKAEETGFANAYRYVGKYGVQFEDSTMYFMRARYYNPIKGRFMGEDPVWSFNLYTYGDNNAQIHIDAQGLAPESLEYFNEMKEIYKQAAPTVGAAASSIATLIKGSKLAKAINALSAIEAAKVTAAMESLLNSIGNSSNTFMFFPILQFINPDLMQMQNQGQIVAKNNKTNSNNSIRNVDPKGTKSFTDPGMQQGFDGINLPGASSFNKCRTKTVWWLLPWTWNFNKRCN